MRGSIGNCSTFEANWALQYCGKSRHLQLQLRVGRPVRTQTLGSSVANTLFLPAVNSPFLPSAPAQKVRP
jgi:hypothetical protein